MQNRNYGPGTQNNNNGAGSQNIIYGGEVYFIHNFNTAERNPHRTLWDAVANIGASHNSEQQYERGECLPGTREKAIQRILNWIVSMGEHPLFWLTGAAGVGKSAIAMTIAKLCQKNGHLVASFFFFRADSKRNNPSALILTIAYGLVKTRPLLRSVIEKRISRDPMILNARLEEQFEELIEKPLARQPPVLSPKPSKPSFHRKLSGRIDKILGKHSPVENKHQAIQPDLSRLVIIDGLDECGDEETQKRVLSTIRSVFERYPSFPLRFLICSRSESWLREAFNMPSLQPLHECIVLEKSFSPNEDILRYYNYHFQEIRADPQYNQVKFPTPWPSKSDFDTLVERTDTHFVYAATIIRFIRQAFSQPVEQLQIILKNTPHRRPGVLPFEQLSALYSFILGVNPHREEVVSIVAAILVIPSHDKESARCPTCIELVLGLPTGQVALTLRGMHSVLDIRGFCDEIRLFHNSFREYLVDPRQSGPFYIDERTWKHIIARIWLENLSTRKIRNYSSSQLWDKENRPFFQEWIAFCTSIHEPTSDLLDALRDVDLAATLVISGLSYWEGVYEELVPWVEKYLSGSDETGVQEGLSEIRDHPKIGKNLRLKADGYPSYDNGQFNLAAPNPRIDRPRDHLNLVEALIHKFQNRPQCFHLEWPSGVSPPVHVLYWIVRRAARCIYSTSGLDATRPSATIDIRLTECHCNLSGGTESYDPWHLAYQEACLKLVKAYVSLFEELSQSTAEDGGTIEELRRIFWNLTESALFKHCRLDTELLSLCRMFLGLVKGCLIMRIPSDWGEDGRKNMLAWFEALPDRFAAEGETLKAQFLGLPWERWEQNFR